MKTREQLRQRLKEIEKRGEQLAGEAAKIYAIKLGYESKQYVLDEETEKLDIEKGNLLMELGKYES